MAGLDRPSVGLKSFCSSLLMDTRIKPAHEAPKRVAGVKRNVTRDRLTGCLGCRAVAHLTDRRLGRYEASGRYLRTSIQASCPVSTVLHSCTGMFTLSLRFNSGTKYIVKSSEEIRRSPTNVLASVNSRFLPTMSLMSWRTTFSTEGSSCCMDSLFAVWIILARRGTESDLNCVYR